MRSLESALSIDDLRTLARRRVPRIAFDYLDGGVESEAGIARNRRALAGDHLERFRAHSLAVVRQSHRQRGDERRRCRAGNCRRRRRHCRFEHGGRQLDTAPATIDVLPEIAAAVQKRVPILFDSGVRRGSDIAKALALGAHFVLVGRATLYGAGAGGAAGVRRAIAILLDEFDRVLGQLGCVSIADLTPQRVRRAPIP